MIIGCRRVATPFVLKVSYRFSCGYDRDISYWFFKTQCILPFYNTMIIKNVRSF